MKTLTLSQTAELLNIPIYSVQHLAKTRKINRHKEGLYEKESVMKYLESKNASYTAAEVMGMDKTLFKNLSRICESGKIKKLGRGLYSKESVDAYI